MCRRPVAPLAGNKFGTDEVRRLRFKLAKRTRGQVGVGPSRDRASTKANRNDREGDREQQRTPRLGFSRSLLLSDPCRS